MVEKRFHYLNNSRLRNSRKGIETEAEWGADR